MSNDIKQEEIIETSASEVEKVVDETTQDPLENELKKIQKKGEGKTQLEKAIHRRKILDEEIRNLKGDEVETTEEEVNDDDAPVTVGMLKKIQQQTATKTALQLADEIPNEIERELIKHHISNSIKSTGNPSEDLKLARAIVNSVKNTQIAEELGRKGIAKTFSSASSASSKIGIDNEPEFTKEELDYMKPPFNLTKADILKSRG